MEGTLMVDAPEPVAHAASSTSAALSKKIGPLPAGVWAAVIVGGLGLAYYINSRSAVTDGADAAGSYEDVPPEAGANNATQPGAGNLYQPDVYGPGGTTTNAPKSNNAWRFAAVAALAGAGRNPYSSTIACTRFLNGRRLSPRQEQLVSEAIQLVGPPPQGVKLPPHADKPKPGDQHGRPHKPANNAEWIQLAVTKLVDKGRDRQNAHTALTRWLDGDKITPAQHDIVAQAQRLAGKPPDPPTHHGGISSHQDGAHERRQPGHVAGRRDDGRMPTRGASFAEVS